MASSMQSKTILITGTSSGIGRLTTLACARAGHFVYVGMRNTADRNRAAAEGLSVIAKNEGLGIRVIDLDVTEQSSIDEALRTINENGTSIDVLVNNAGHMSIGIAEAFSDAKVRSQFEVNTFAPIRMTKAVLPAMRRRRSGLIVHVSSIVGRLLFPGCAYYCASEFALEAFAEVLNYELTGFDIDSVIVEPGPFGTQLLANSPGPDGQSIADSYEKLSTLREMFVANFAAFFASDVAPDPQINADAILRLIQLPQGKRPLRTVCGVDYGTVVLNKNNAPIQAQVLREIGMAFLESRTGLGDG